MTIAPLCFNSLKQYKEWKRYSGLSDSKEFNYCSDCLPEYKEKMCKEGRCNYPDTLFINSDGGLEGVRN